MLKISIFCVTADARTSAAIDHLSMLLGFLRVWGLEKVVKIDALMSPSEEYFDASYFQVIFLIWGYILVNLNALMVFIFFSCFGTYS